MSESRSELRVPWFRKPGAVLAVIVCTWALVLIVRSPASVRPVMCDVDFAPQADTVVMLSASWCGYCRRAREFLQQREIAHCEYDIETTDEGRRRFSQTPVKVIPIIHIGKDTLVGFDVLELSQTLITNGLSDFEDYDRLTEAQTR